MEYPNIHIICLNTHNFERLMQIRNDLERTNHPITGNGAQFSEKQTEIVKWFHPQECLQERRRNILMRSRQNQGLNLLIFSIGKISTETKYNGRL